MDQEEGVMTEFSVNVSRLDPYKNFKFRVRWDGKEVAGVSRVSGLTRTTKVVENREGGDPSTIRKSPGATRFAPIVLTRGITHDSAFEDWANKVWNLGGGAGSEVSLKDFRKDILIDLHNEAGQLVKSFRLFRCWPSEYAALPELDAAQNSVAIESLVLENEGWERDASVTEPEEPAL
jgi:phage tail-like protein